MAKHKKLLSTPVNTAEKRQQTFKNFISKWAEAFPAADIPLFKLQHPQILQLFTHLGQPVPSESSCRKHVDKLAVDEKQRLKERLHNKNPFLVVDESEINGNKYLNILIGDTAVPETTYVLGCSIVQTVSQQIVTVKIDDALKKLDIQRHNFALLLSDAAPLHDCMHRRAQVPAWRVFCTSVLRKLTISLQKTGATSSTRSVHHHSQCSLAGAHGWMQQGTTPKTLWKCARLSMHLKVTVFWLATLKLLLMIPTLLNYLQRFTATTKCFPRWFRRLRVRSTLLKKRTLTSRLSTWKKIVWVSARTSKSACLRTVTWKTKTFMIFFWSKFCFI